MKPLANRKTNYKDWLFGKDGALFRAAAQGRINLAKQLIAEGADVNVASNNGFTPLHRASERGHGEIVSLLLENGANPNELSNDGDSPMTLATDNGHKDIANTLRERLRNEHT